MEHVLHRGSNYAYVRAGFLIRPHTGFENFPRRNLMSRPPRNSINQVRGGGGKLFLIQLNSDNREFDSCVWKSVTIRINLIIFDP